MHQSHISPGFNSSNASFDNRILLWNGALWDISYALRDESISMQSTSWWDIGSLIFYDIIICPERILSTWRAKTGVLPDIVVNDMAADTLVLVTPGHQ